MMFILFLPLFIRSDGDEPNMEEIFKQIKQIIPKLPHFSLLMEFPGIPEKELAQLNEQISQVKSCSLWDKDEDLEPESKDQIKSICKSIMEPFQDIYVSTGKNVNDLIAQVTPQTQVLIVATPVQEKIDFRKLKSSTTVICMNVLKLFSGEDEGEELSGKPNILKPFKNLVKAVSKNSFKGTPKSASKLFKNLKKGREDTEESLSKIQIVGSMKEKVSYLFAAAFEITFVDAPCDAQNLHLSDSSLSKSSKGVESDYLYLSGGSVNLAEYYGEKVKQTTIIHQDYYDLCNTMTIEYGSESLSIKRSNCQFEEESSSETMIIYYHSAKQAIGLIGDYNYSRYTKPLTVNINYASEKALPNILDLNLSFGQNYNSGLFGLENYLGSLFGKPEELEGSLPKVEFKLNNWEKATKKPTLAVVADKDVVNVDTTEAEKVLPNVVKEEPAKIPPNPDDDDDDGLSAGAIAGIVIACVVVVAAIVAVIVYFVVIRKKNDSSHEAEK